MQITSIFSRTLLSQILITGVLEFGPLLSFLLSYDYFYVYKATFVLMVTTIVSTVITFKLQKRLPYFALYVALLTIVFGYMTLMKHNPHFIQVRDTVFDVINALVLVTGLLFGKVLLKKVFHAAVPLSDRAWKTQTYAWILFFITAASCNEYVRHVHQFGDWIVYKTAMTFVTAVFGVAIFFIAYEKGEPVKV